ncbi:uncharacterized protein V6R79_019973 [Siganus canaliculatus]
MSTFLWEDSHLLNSPQLHFQTLSSFMCGGNTGREEAAGFFLVSPGPSEDTSSSGWTQSENQMRDGMWKFFSSRQEQQQQQCSRSS